MRVTMTSTNLETCKIQRGYRVITQDQGYGYRSWLKSAQLLRVLRSNTYLNKPLFFPVKKLAQPMHRHSVNIYLANHYSQGLLSMFYVQNVLFVVLPLFMGTIISIPRNLFFLINFFQQRRMYLRCVKCMKNIFVKYT